MRQSNQKSRSRGRGRKQHNPMSKNFESNGPDVKIRGNASHIAEKYSSLARDAQSNGDTVMAENYYQHAEHYNRIVAAAQLQNQQRAEEAAANNANGKGPQPNVEGESAEAANGDGTVEANAEQDVSSQDNGAESTNGEAKPRRNTRSRSKPKAAAEPSNGAEDTQPSSSDEGETVSAEVISDDASKLPGSIIGETSAEDA